MADKEIKITLEAEDRTTAELAKARGEIEKTAASAMKANKIMAARELLGVRPYKDIQADITKLRGAYDDLKKSGNLSSAELMQAKQALARKTSELKKETGDWGAELKKAKAGLVALAGAGYAAVKSFQKYSEFSQRMAEVNTLLDVSDEKFASMTKEVKNLSRELPQTASELAAAQYDLISAGVALDQSIGVLEKSAKAAVAGVTDTKTAANAGISVINAYGKSLDEIEGVYDLLFKTVKAGVTTFPELAQNIGQVLPTAKAANVEFINVAAAVATMTKAGIHTPQAMTSLKGAINALAAPTQRAKGQFQALGITWEGLIPTLDKIREKNLSIDQMRLLIPNVEARTGVLALTQNFDNLVSTLNEMEASGGAMEAAYQKMKDTPENQMKLFRNEMDLIKISAGELIAKALLPLAKTTRELIAGWKDVDLLSKILIGVFTSVAGATTAWNLGLKHIVKGLGGFITKTRKAQIATGSLAKQFVALNAVTAVAAAGLAAWAGYNVYMAAKAAIEWRKAVKVEIEAQNNLYANTTRVMRKFEEFKGFRLPADITKASQQELDEYRKKLASARAYYTAFKMKLEEEGGSPVALQKVNERLKEIQSEFKRVGEAAANAASDMEKPAEALEATEEHLKTFEESAKKAYDEATKQAENYAKKVIEWEDKIKYAKLSTEDKIRELGRKGLSDAEVWADKKKQAEEKLIAARMAMYREDYQLAEKLAKDAEGLYADLATEVKGTDAGKDVVIRSLEDTKAVAINGVKEVGQFVDDLYGRQKDAAQTAQREWKSTADEIQKQLDEVAKQRDANVVIQLRQLEAAQNAINSLIKPEYKDIYVRVHQQQAKAQGGYVSNYGESTTQVRARTGLKLPGYGGGDKIRALLEAGEFVIRKEAVKKYGAGLFEALNSMRVDTNDAIKQRISGIFSSLTVPVPRYAYQTGGPVMGAASRENEVFTLRLQAGEVDMPLNVMGNRQTMRNMVKEFEKELIKLGMVKR